MEYYKNLSLEDLFYINDDGLVCCEEWRDVINYKGFYQVSDLGRVKSLKRTITRKDGREQKFKSRILRPGITQAGYLYVGISNTKKVTGYTVHQLVAMAFLEHIPSRYKIAVDHKNDIKLDCRLVNLHILTHRGNISKSKKSESTKTGVCKKGEKFSVSFIFESKTVYLGRFPTLDQANFIYEEAIRLIDLNKSFEHLKTDKKTKTGIKGVYLEKGRFRVIYYKNYKFTRLGAYGTANEAKSVYDNYVANEMRKQFKN